MAISDARYGFCWMQFSNSFEKVPLKNLLDFSTDFSTFPDFIVLVFFLTQLLDFFLKKFSHQISRNIYRPLVSLGFF